MTRRILRLKDLMDHTGLSRSAIYDRMDVKSPRYAPDFPKSFSLDGGAVGWFQDEVNAWLEKCATAPKTKKRSVKVSAPTTARATARTPESRIKTPPPMRDGLKIWRRPLFPAARSTT